MICEKAIYDDGGIRVLFHLRLFTDYRNRLYSSLPPPLLLKYFQSELFHIKNALIINAAQANRLLEALAHEILQKTEINLYFYPEYLTSSDFGKDTFDRILWLQHKFNLRPEMFFSPERCPIEFYYIEQVYKMSKAQIFKTGNPILFEVFKKKYLTNSIIQDSFYNSANEADIFLEMDDETFDYVLILSETGSLKMLITI